MNNNNMVHFLYTNLVCCSLLLSYSHKSTIGKKIERTKAKIRIPREYVDGWTR